MSIITDSASAVAADIAQSLGGPPPRAPTEPSEGWGPPTTGAPPPAPLPAPDPQQSLGAGGAPYPTIRFSTPLAGTPQQQGPWGVPEPGSGELMTPARIGFIGDEGGPQPDFSAAFPGGYENTPFRQQQDALGWPRREQADSEANIDREVRLQGAYAPKYDALDLTGIPDTAPDPLNFAALSQDAPLRRAIAQLTPRLGPKGEETLRDNAIVDSTGTYGGTAYQPATRQLMIHPGTSDPATLAHELAHAYEDRFLTPQQREQFYNTLLDLARNGDPVARDAIANNSGDPQHMFTYIAEQAYKGQRVPDALKSYVAGLFKNPGVHPANEPPSSPDLGIRSPGPPNIPTAADLNPEAAQNFAAFDMQRQLDQLRQVQQIAQHFRFLNQMGVADQQRKLADANAPYGAPMYPGGPAFARPNPAFAGAPDRSILSSAASLGKEGLGVAASIPQLIGEGINKLPAVGLPGASPQGMSGYQGKTVGQSDPMTQLIEQSLPYILLPEAGAAGQVANKALLSAALINPAEHAVQGKLTPQDILQAAPILGPELARVGARTIPEVVAWFRSPEGQAALADVGKTLASQRGGGPPEGVPPEGVPRETPAEPFQRPADMALTEPLYASRLPEPGAEPSAPTTADQAALQVSEWLRKGEKARPEQQAMFAEQRAAQMQRMESVYQADNPNAFQEAKAAGAGAFKRPELAPLELAPEMEAAVKSEINTSPMYDHAGQRTNAHEALAAMQAGHLPEPAQAVELSKILGGPQFLEAFTKAAPVNWSSEILGALGIPQALQTTMDASAILRQMAPLGWTNPKAYFDAIGTIGRAFGSDEAAIEVQHETMSLPWMSTAPVPGAEGLTFNALGGRMADIGGHLQESEGQFSALNRSKASQLVEKLPWVKPSERIYNVPINRLRADVYSKFAQNMWDAGERNPKMYKAVVDVVDHGSGWGTWELGQIGRGLNAFYAPRNFTARLQVLLDPILQPGSLLKPSARQLAARNLVGFVGANGAMLGLMAGSGALAGYALGVPNPVHIEMDPRSTDSWKGRIGNLRIDMTGGYGSILRLVARLSPLLAGEAPQVKDINGVVRSAAPADLLDTFLRGKLGPVPGFIWDALKLPGGQGYAADVKSGEGLRTFAFNSLTPFFVQDVVNAWRDQGKAGAAVAAPVSFFGGGVNSYQPSALSATLAAKAQINKAGFQQFVDRRSALQAQHKKLADQYGANFALSRDPQAVQAARTLQRNYQQLDAAEYAFWRTHRDLLKQAIQQKAITPSRRLMQLADVQ